MKVIDLLNKIANKENVPTKIRFNGWEFTYDTDTGLYLNTEAMSLGQKYVLEMHLNDEIEVIEENQDIDIQSIEELNDSCYDRHFYGEDKEYYHNLTRETLNKLLRWAKQLDRQINNN